MIEYDVRQDRQRGRTVPASPEEIALAGRREVLELLHRVAVNMETAAVLDLRAEQSANPTLAAVLHERAAQRRRVAERIRAGLQQRDLGVAG